MTNHYDVLQISEDADESTIKRAWARLVRQHPPDKDPKGNLRLSQAKTTLLDTRARADYDAELKYGEEINALLEEGQEAMEETDYVKAVAAFKEVLALHPDSLHARNQLSLAYAYQERYPEAVQQLKRLVEKAPESALYAANLGRIYMEWSGVDEHNTPNQVENQAEIWFKKATELESYNSEHHIALARLYMKLNRYSEAEAALENAISADGKVDTDDIDTLLELTWVYLFSDQKHRIVEVGERIRLIIQDEPDANEYALHQFVRMAVNLIVEHNAYQCAEAFVKAARQLGVDMEENVVEVVDSIEKNALIDRQADAMREDESIHPSVVGAMLAAAAHKRLNFDIPEHFFDGLSEAMTTWSQGEIRSVVKVCKRKYPMAYASIEDIIEDIIKLGRIQGGSKAGRDTIDYLPTVWNSGVANPPEQKLSLFQEPDEERKVLIESDLCLNCKSPKKDYWDTAKGRCMACGDWGFAPVVSNQNTPQTRNSKVEEDARKERINNTSSAEGSSSCLLIVAAIVLIAMFWHVILVVFCICIAIGVLRAVFSN